MAKYQTKCFTGQRPIVLPEGAGAEWTAVDIEFSATAPAASDLYQLATLPIGAKVLDWALVLPDLDSGGSALVWSLGTENTGGTDLSAEVWGATLAAGAAGAVVRNALAVCAQGDITAVRNIDLKCTTAATTWAGSGKVGQLLMLLQM